MTQKQLAKSYSHLNGKQVMVYIGRVPCRYKHIQYELCLYEKENVYGKYEPITIGIVRTHFNGKVLTITPEIKCDGTVNVFKIDKNDIDKLLELEIKPKPSENDESNGVVLCRVKQTYTIQDFTFTQSRDIHDYIPILSPLGEDFGTVLQWCGLIPQPSGEVDTYWNVWLVRYRGDVVGICGLYTLTGSVGTSELWLGRLGIIPSMRDKKYGGIILDFLYGVANNIGCQVIRTYIDKDLRPLNFYIKNGFTFKCKVSEYIKSLGDDGEVLMGEFEDMDDVIVEKYLSN